MTASAASRETAWPVLIKADDLSVNSDLAAWDRFVAIVNGAGASCDIGVILKPAETTTLAPLQAWLERQDQAVVSFFDHGAEHTREEFKSGLERAAFAGRFRALAESERRYFGRRLEGFGAPYNSLCAAAIEGYFDTNPSGYIYYPDREPANEGVARGRFVSIRHHVSFELREQGNDPSADYFRRTHQRRIDVRQPLVLQVHPGRWSARGFDEFAAILNHVRRHGASFLSAPAFIAATTAGQPGAPVEPATMVVDNEADAIARQAGGWFAKRFDPVELEKTRALVQQVLQIRPVERWRGTSVLDTGCGIGDWLYLLRRGAPFERLYGLEPRDDVAALARRILDADAPGRYRVIGAAVGAPVDLEEPCALTVCNRALNYFDVFAYLDLIGTRGRADAHHFIGYQSFAFYWCGLRSALTQDKLDIARRRVQVLSHSLRRIAGLAAGRSQESVLPLADLVALLALHGHRLVKQFPVQRHASSAVMVEGLVFEAGAPAGEGTTLTSRELATRLAERGGAPVALRPLDGETLQRIEALGAARPAVGRPDGDPLHLVLTAVELFAAGRHADCLRLLKERPDPGL